MMSHKHDEEIDAGNDPYDTPSLESLGVHMFFGAVDSEKALAASEFILKSNIVQKKYQNLTLFLNTVGGDCGDGFAIIDMMETSRLPIATVGIGSIMSMGVLILSAGSPGMRTITKNTEVMAHQFSTWIEGKHHELLAVQSAYKQLEDRFIRHFKSHSKMTERQVRDILFAPSDRYLTPAECLKYGLVDRVVSYAEQLKPLQLSSAVGKPKINKILKSTNRSTE